MKKILILLFIIGSVTQCFNKDNMKQDNSKLQIDNSVKQYLITGVIKVYGSEPHTYVGIKSENKKIFYIHPDYASKVRKLQNEKYLFTVKNYDGDKKFHYTMLGNDPVVIPVSWEKIK